MEVSPCFSVKVVSIGTVPPFTIVRYDNFIGLNLQDIFDFYQEIGNLTKQCVNDEETAVPYPLTGFQSPTLFVCKKDIVNCSHYEGGVKAVNLVKKLGELAPGEYKRCKLLTPKLIQFYKEHYGEIKETASE